MIPLRLYSLILVVSGVVLAIYLLLRRKPKTADDLERERRQWLDQIGRITDGTVIDVQEMDSGQKPSTLLIYQYDVAGVSYEASQDVATLHVLSGSYRKVPEMSVTGGNPATMINDYGPTVAAHKVSE